MRIRLNVMSSFLLAAAMFWCTGCGETTNEEGLDKGRAPGEVKEYKSYGDYALQKAEEAKKNNEAAKAKPGTTKKP